MCRGVRARYDEQNCKEQSGNDWICAAKGNCNMTCEEFEAIGLHVERDASLSEAERSSAREHVDSCPRCAALLDSWLAARMELRTLAVATGAEQTPARVEMRLRQEFRTQHHTVKARRAAVIAAWALATAAVLVGAVSWQNWRASQHQKEAAGGNRGTNQLIPNQVSSESGTLVADSELSDFTLLPGVLLSDTDDTAIMRVRMQRGALGALGLPVNEDGATDWIQVDLLVGNDGLPQAVRLPQED
jgi:hypothetical protein